MEIDKTIGKSLLDGWRVENGKMLSPGVEIYCDTQMLSSPQNIAEKRRRGEEERLAAQDRVHHELRIRDLGQVRHHEAARGEGGQSAAGRRSSAAPWKMSHTRGERTLKKCRRSLV